MTMTAVNNLVSIQASNPPADLRSVFGVQIGRDRSGNFAASLSGLAVRTSDGRCLVPSSRREEGAHVFELVDVTGLTLGVDPYAFRIPVISVEPGDLILISESPFSVLLVQEVSENGSRVRGLAPGRREIVEYVRPRNPFNVSFFVRVVSIFDFLDSGEIAHGAGGRRGPRGGDLGQLLPFFLLSQGGRRSTSDSTSKLLALLAISQASGGNQQNFLPLLLLLDMEGESSLEALLLSQWARMGNLRGFGFTPPAPSQRPERPATEK